MNITWKSIFLIGAFLLAAMAIYVIWFNAAVPEILVKSFLSLFVGGLLLSVLQTMFRRADKT